MFLIYTMHKIEEYIFTLVKRQDQRLRPVRSVMIHRENLHLSVTQGQERSMSETTSVGDPVVRASQIQSI